MYASLLTFILSGIASVYSGQHNTCNVFPKDQYVEVGKSITITCQSSCVAGNVYWTLNNKEIDDSLSKTLNSTHTVLSLSNFTHPSATLQCHSANTQQVIGGTTIRSYSKPKNISCIWHHNYTGQEPDGQADLLTCTWEHQMDPSVAINYIVEGVVHSDSTKIQCNKQQETKCTFKDFVELDNDSVTVTVKAITEAWSVSSDRRTFVLKSIWKTLPPKKLNVMENTGQLVVSWERLSPLKECVCEVKCSKISAKGGTVECDHNELENTSTSIPRDVDTGSIVIKNVESCSTYTFSVRCALLEALWSNWSTETTHLTKPQKYINLQLWRKVSEVGKNGLRKVHVMWTGIPSTCNGAFIYVIKQTGVNDTLCDNTTCDVDVNQDAQRINLTVLHDGAVLVEKSIYIPAVGESLPRVTDIRTTSDDNVIRVSWTAPAQPASEGYMIDWTHNGGQYYWKKSEYTNATLLDLLDKKPYNISVTPLFGDETGQSTQALQVCSRFGDPDGIAISVEADHQSASVSWSTMSQSECSGAVVGYTVYYYEGQDGPLLSVPVDSETKKVSLKNLKPNTQYTVYVEAAALTGRTKSSERKFATKKFDPQLFTVLIVSGTIIIVLVLLLGLCFAVQWKNFKEKPVPNPSLSSVGVWARTHQKPQRVCFQPFSNPSESPCDTVYPDKAQSVPTPSQVTGSDTNTASDNTEDYTNSGVTPAPHMQGESPVEPVEMPPSPGESTALISSEGSPLNPYRSQSSVESPVPRASKQGKHATVKQQDKTPPKTVYVTLDMI